MAELIIELPTEAYEKLKNEATLHGKSPETLAQELVVSHLSNAQTTNLSERERGRQALLAAGLLTELGPELKKMAEASTATLEEVQRFLTPGKPLSEIVIEQREQNF